MPSLLKHAHNTRLPFSARHNTREGTSKCACGKKISANKSVCASCADAMLKARQKE